jgi:hypothetical protein
MGSSSVYDRGTPHFEIDVEVSQGDRSDGPQLTEQELQGISSKIFGKTRGVEVLWDIQDQACFGRIKVLLDIEARRLSKEGPESIVSFLRSSHLM